MGTRGTYGFRKDGVDKLTYNHFDSYPSYLGEKIVSFCYEHSIEEFNELFDKIVLVNESEKPTPEQIDICRQNGLINLAVSSKSEDDWYCLLRNCQGDLDALFEMNNKAYMIDNGDFIKNSLWCEYGYIINLDEEVLEYYEGFQKQPQSDNRYGCIPDEHGYYPCKLILEIPLNELDDVDKIVHMMELGEDAEDVIAAIERNSEYDLTDEEAKELGDKKIYALFENIDEAAEHEARQTGILTDDNERYFDLELYGDDLLDNCGWMEFESTGRVVYYEC